MLYSVLSKWQIEEVTRNTTMSGEDSIAIPLSLIHQTNNAVQCLKQMGCSINQTSNVTNDLIYSTDKYESNSTSLSKCRLVFYLRVSSVALFTNP